MNVYFTASIVGKKDYLKHYEHIITLLQSKGYTVQAEHILNVTEPEIHMKTRDERLKFHKKLQNWIQKADFVVVEASFPSISVGYEIAIALQYRKPVLILYSVGDPPSLFGHHSDEKIVCEKYTLDTAEGIVNEFIHYVQGASDTRFTFFVTPQIAAYLEKVSVKAKMPKSVYLRTLIENHIKNNPVK
jgi:2'-deoxynucleoside 5'-phosphate N-hydrolase